MGVGSHQFEADSNESNHAPQMARPEIECYDLRSNPSAPGDGYVTFDHAQWDGRYSRSDSDPADDGAHEQPDADSDQQFECTLPLLLLPLLLLLLLLILLLLTPAKGHSHLPLGRKT
eukprot:9470000-Pyramimonas_sp.AAC.2